MTFFDILFVVLLCVLSFYLGKKNKKETKKEFYDSNYSKVRYVHNIQMNENDDDDEEKIIPLIEKQN